MSEARAKSKTKAEEPPADDGELDKIADELYGLRPDEFAAARDEQVKKARAQGQAALARELNKLRKPTQSAWLVNLLWRDQRDVMQQLLDLGEALSRAQAQASGPDMLRLTGQRRELEAALMRRARALAEQAGVTVTAPMEREAQETLSAAVAMPEVADEVRSGRLVKPAAYAGFGAGFGGLIPPAHANRAERRAADAADDDAEPHRVDDSKRKDATPKPDELASRRAASLIGTRTLSLRARPPSSRVGLERWLTSRPGRRSESANGAQRWNGALQMRGQLWTTPRACWPIAIGQLKLRRSSNRSCRTSNRPFGSGWLSCRRKSTTCASASATCKRRSSRPSKPRSPRDGGGTRRRRRTKPRGRRSSRSSSSSRSPPEVARPVH